MPIYYACESEEQAKEECLKMGGLYTGRSALCSGSYTWQTFTKFCITSFCRIDDAGIRRFMVVYNDRSAAFECIAIGGDSPVPQSFVTGSCEDAPADLRSRYSQFRYDREESRRKAKSLLLVKAKATDESRLRKVKGKTIQVISGTTIKHGTQGRVFWVGFGEKGDPRVGFTDKEGNRRWTALKNVCEAQEFPLLELAS